MRSGTPPHEEGTFAQLRFPVNLDSPVHRFRQPIWTRVTVAAPDAVGAVYGRQGTCRHTVETDHPEIGSV